VRILVLGGTRFLGRAFADAALALGHELALFTRGQTNPALFPEAEHFGGDRALIVRPGLIVGPHDDSGRFTYWPHRVARGGDVPAPGSPDDLKQFIDVRDLAEWMLQADISKALGAGLIFRPLEDTVRATLAAAELVEGVGLSQERERELLGG
jgi:nucleoside-diphosphate-sugar epimerase